MHVQVLTIDINRKEEIYTVMLKLKPSVILGERFARLIASRIVCEQDELITGYYLTYSIS